MVGIIAGAVYVLTRTDGTPPFFQCLPQEALFLHLHHPWLRITIGGVGNVTIPAGIGIVSPQYNSNGIAVGGSCFEPMHTHDSSGIVHIESPDRTNYTLGNFFQIWDYSYHTISFGGAIRPVVFNKTDILGYTSDQTHQIRLQVDGTNSNAYGSLVMNQYDYCSSQLSGYSSPCYPTDANTQGIIGTHTMGAKRTRWGPFTPSSSTTQQSARRIDTNCARRNMITGSLVDGPRASRPSSDRSVVLPNRDLRASHP